MDTNTFVHKKLIELIPEDVRKKITTLPVTEAGFGAGPGFCAVQRWQYDPPISLLEALFKLERYRELLRRCHVHFSDGTRLILERHQFHAFYPSAKLRRRHTAGVGPDGVIRERFQFCDFDEWPDTLASDIEVFKQVHRVAPNVLVASREVYVEIDRVARAHRDMVVDESGRHPDKDEPFEISGFNVDDCEVEFVLADTIQSPECMLVYDPEPGFDGEPEGIPGTNISARVLRAG